MDILDYQRARAVINNWRSSHAFPLNTFQMNLRDKTRVVDSAGFVAQRIKRLPAIQHKLERMPHLRLASIQDVGGCRAVVRSVAQVRKLRDMIRRSRIKHRFERETDYITEPKEVGYRGIHLVYRYHSDRTQAYEGLRIELQFRTMLQHAWATAVETVGQFRQEMLKSDEGDEDWLRFFALMGTAIANREKCPPVPNTPTSERELAGELKECAATLDIINQLESYRMAVTVTPSLKEIPTLKGKHFFLLRFDLETKDISVTGYMQSEVEEASRAYQELEKASFAQEGPNVVLVSVERANLLQRAYPNFFLDTTKFVDEVKRVIEK